MTLRHTILPAAICVIAITQSVSARPRAASATPATNNHPVLIELFTSEGCSSCPPADRLLTEFVTQSPVLGVNVIALSEHVDYWDGLGWRDPFSSKQFTERQDRYATHFGPDKLYTPQMIVDGTTELVGSDRNAAIAALKKVAAQTAASTVTLSWQTAAKTRQLDVSIAGAPKSDVWMALTQDGLTSDVKRGENAGKQLPHTAVTRWLKKIGETDARGQFTSSQAVAVDASLPLAAMRVVLFAQASGQRAITGVNTIHVPAA